MTVALLVIVLVVVVPLVVVEIVMIVCMKATTLLMVAVLVVVVLVVVVLVVIPYCAGACAVFDCAVDGCAVGGCAGGATILRWRLCPVLLLVWAKHRNQRTQPKAGPVARDDADLGKAQWPEDPVEDRPCRPRRRWFGRAPVHPVSVGTEGESKNLR